MASKWILRATQLMAVSSLMTACGDGPSVSTDAGTVRDAQMADASMMMEDGGTDASTAPDGGGPVVPATYAFESRFMSGVSSVSYSGQTARHVLISDLNAFIGGLNGGISAGTYPPGGGGVTEELVLADLNYYFENTAAERGSDAIRLSTTPAATQSTYGDLSGTAFLIEKLAGNDTSTDHRTWATEFVGFGDAASFRGASLDISNPTVTLRAFFSTIAANAVDAYNGADRTAPGHTGALPVHVTSDGLDLQQLTQKFLLGAIAFSQGADDYLDDDVADKGLLSPNTQSGTSAYSGLEHAWDEGFGYFGAARDYGTYDRSVIAGSSPYRDSDSNGQIDLFSEFNFGASTNAAKRDLGSAASAMTNFVGQADSAFRTGRALIAAAGDEVSEDELAAIRVQRDLAVEAWESALAATIVHYINEVLQDMGRFGTGEYVFLDHAKHWSELKGFALGLQFNPRSPLLTEDAGEERFVTLHELLGDRPVLSDGESVEITEYRANLLAARALLGTAYGFDAANLGDDEGNGGW
jgi:hypothetical protein